LAKSIKPADLEDAIKEELTLYHKDVLEKVNAAGKKAVKLLVKLTKETAPVREGEFQNAITYKEKENKASGDKEYIWGAKSPKHRLTHLLVKGHAKKNGGRVPGDPFLENALDQVLPEYEREVEEALENVK
jgi:hypothetical protein